MRYVLVVVLATGCVDDLGPRLESATPNAAGRNAMVTLVGSRLCGENANCDTAAGRIQLGINPPVVIANVLEYADTGALIMIPAVVEIGPTSIVVTVNERASNALEFEVLP
jgi:hypothetical protein